MKNAANDNAQAYGYGSRERRRSVILRRRPKAALEG
jgi:hypothetical protein